jgi:hypothetical protein
MTPWHAANGFASARMVAMSSISAAEVGSIADGIDLYRSRVAGLAEPLVGSSNEDLIAALHEAERALRNAHRAMRHALKLSKDA